MTIVGKILQAAFRESALIGDMEYPTPQQMRIALVDYNALLRSLYGQDVGETLQNFPLGTFGLDTDVPHPFTNIEWLECPYVNSRLIATNTAPITVALSAWPQDGSRYAIADPYGRLATFPITLNGNGRTIAGGPTITPTAAGEWMYRADMAEWVAISDLAITDESPFPAEFDNLFRILMAMRINPRFGAELSDMTMAILKSQRTAFVARYINSQPLARNDDVSWPFMSRQSYNTGRSFASQVGFNRGLLNG